MAIAPLALAVILPVVLISCSTNTSKDNVKSDYLPDPTIKSRFSEVDFKIVKAGSLKEIAAMFLNVTNINANLVGSYYIESWETVSNGITAEHTTFYSLTPIKSGVENPEFLIKNVVHVPITGDKDKDTRTTKKTITITALVQLFLNLYNTGKAPVTPNP